MIQTPRICVQTYQVRDIEETMKVIIGDMSYWIKIKESGTCYEAEEMITQGNPKSTIDKQQDWAVNTQDNATDDSGEDQNDTLSGHSFGNENLDVYDSEEDIHLEIEQHRQSPVHPTTFTRIFS